MIRMSYKRGDTWQQAYLHIFAYSPGMIRMDAHLVH